MSDRVYLILIGVFFVAVSACALAGAFMNTRKIKPRWLTPSVVWFFFDWTPGQAVVFAVIGVAALILLIQLVFQ
jgi:hypothetical protein